MNNDGSGCIEQLRCECTLVTTFTRIGIGGLLATAGEAPFSQLRTIVDPTTTAGSRRALCQPVPALCAASAAFVFESTYEWRSAGERRP